MRERKSSVILIPANDELAIALCVAERRGKALLIDDGYFVYEIKVESATRAHEFYNPEGKPDSLLNIIGIVASEEPTSVAENLDEYLADAYESDRS